MTDEREVKGCFQREMSMNGPLKESSAGERVSIQCTRD